ncbi:MAG: hypothetical protein ACRCZI_02435 [Cetobacterium sp.]
MSLKFICVEDEFVLINKTRDREVAITLTPSGDCCSANWFDYSNLPVDLDTYLEQFADKKFDKWECEMKYRATELKDPYDDVCYEEYDVFINFKDGSSFQFTFCHSCNGYYSGWIHES